LEEVGRLLKLERTTEIVKQVIQILNKDPLTPQQANSFAAEARDLKDTRDKVEANLIQNSKEYSILQKWIDTGVRPELIPTKSKTNMTDATVYTSGGMASGAATLRTAILLIQKIMPDYFAEVTTGAVGYIAKNPGISGAIIGGILVAGYLYQDNLKVLGYNASIEEYNKTISEILKSVESHSDSEVAKIKDNATQMYLNNTPDSKNRFVPNQSHKKSVTKQDESAPKFPTAIERKRYLEYENATLKESLETLNKSIADFDLILTGY